MYKTCQYLNYFQPIPGVISVAHIISHLLNISQGRRYTPWHNLKKFKSHSIYSQFISSAPIPVVISNCWRLSKLSCKSLPLQFTFYNMKILTVIRVITQPHTLSQRFLHPPTSLSCTAKISHLVLYFSLIFFHFIGSNYCKSNYKVSQ